MNTNMMKASLLLASLATISGFRFDPPTRDRRCVVPLRSHRTSPHPTESRFDDEREASSRRSCDGLSRRSLLQSVGLSLAGAVSSGPFAAALLSIVNLDLTNAVDDEKLGGGMNVANAMGLVQFPCKPGDLANTYHMMRAGESGLEAERILSTNPLFLTNREDALTATGIMQVEEACKTMMTRGINPSVVKYSLAAKSIDSANIVATTMMVGRNRIVPEFTFMDPRGAGLWDGKPLASTEAAIWAMDVAEAGDEGRDGRPPQNDDGTANETLFNQVTRLRQLMSILETQYSGDSILLIFPDGTSPALLSCLIAGIPLKNVHALDFAPGELREGVDMNNARELLKERISSPAYNEVLAIGRDELERLREVERIKILEKEKPRELLVTKPQEPMPQSKARSRVIERNDGVTNFGDNFYPVGAMGAMATMAMWRGGEKDSDESSSKTKSSTANAAPILAYANSTGSSVLEQQTAGSYRTSQNRLGSPTGVVHMAAANVVDAGAGQLDPNVFEDVPVLSKQERVEAAERAMEEYLSQDDGGDDWLASMKDLMDEE